MDCLIIGDSIAHGLHSYMPHCRVMARTAATDLWSPLRLIPHEADVIIVSLGSNGYTIPGLRSVRLRSRARVVIWVMPHSPSSVLFNYITRLAAEFGDAIVRTGDSADGVHPSAPGYRDLIDQIRDAAS